MSIANKIYVHYKRNHFVYIVTFTQHAKALQFIHEIELQIAIENHYDN